MITTTVKWCSLPAAMPLSIALRTSSQPPLCGGRVAGRQRIVEHDDARAGDERPRERDALALAAGEVHAALADQRVVAVRQLPGESVDARRDAGREHLVPRRILAAGEEVL